MTTQALHERIEEFEGSIVEAVAGIDQTDGSRIELQQTLDSVRETLASVYGDSLDDAVAEYLGTDTDDGENEDE
ncbi:MAG: hypothetical protein ACR2L1_02985 [Pyrinomonadaceae bacterium]